MDQNSEQGAGQEAPVGVTGLAALWTIPNLLSIARLLGVPLFLWLILGPHQDWWALAILVFAGVSDWLDGKLARALNQTSKLGTILDPAADRLYILATLAGLLGRSIIPVWLVVLLIGREVFIAGLYPLYRRLGYGLPGVHFVGKTGTLCLLYAFPFLLIGAHDGGYATVAKIIGWSFGIWGTVLYWWAGILYAVQVGRLARACRAED